MKTSWSPNSWRSKPAKHMPTYKDENLLKESLDKIKKFPPLVFAGEARSLKSKLAKLQKVKHFYYKVVIAQKALQIFILIILKTALK